MAWASVERCSAFKESAIKDLGVAADDALSDGGAERRLHRIEIRGHVEMQIEPAMVDGFNRER